MLRRLTRWDKSLRPTSLLLLALLSASMGCQWCGVPGPGTCLPYSVTAMDPGCAQYGGSCDALSCGSTCQDFPATCGACAPGGCGVLGGLILPLLSTNLACGSGCGGVYWGEWMFDPPDCRDSCDDGSCWPGPGGNALCNGYNGGCLQGLLAGPVAVIRGTSMGVASLFYGTCSTLQCGYGYTMGSGNACGCGDCAGALASPACDSCGGASCAGGCAQVGVPTATPIAARPLGTGVQTIQSVSPIAARGQTTKPAHRVVTKRLRR